MANFFAELRRRHIYRVGAAYAVVAWLLLQFVNNVAPVLDLPPWIARAILGWLWHPSYAPVRKTERFKTFVRQTGLVEYWRARGWPEFCHPTIGDDFVCE